jgi:hypothetical protein
MDLPLQMIFDGIDRARRRRHRNAVDDHRDSEFECDRLNSKEMVAMRRAISEGAAREAALSKENQDLRGAVDERDMLLHYWMRESATFSRTMQKFAEGWSSGGVPDPEGGKRLADSIFDEEMARFESLPKEKVDAWKKSRNDSIVQRWQSEAAARRKAGG